jgi:uncharacterized protein
MHKSLWAVFVTITIVGCGNYAKELQDHRIKYKQGFVNDPRSPLDSTDLLDLDFYQPDSKWVMKCSCESVQNAKPFELPTYSGIPRTYIEHSLATCKTRDGSLKLMIYKNINQPINPLYKDNLFLPFKDNTNGETTYGGGRYINLYTYDIQNNKIVIDFNKCYNPWCAYSAGYNCPIPPKVNHIDRSITAGEKNYKGQYKGEKH